MIYLQLFWEYFKAGLFAIGGGMATIPFLTDISQRTGWFTLQELADMVAVSESTPGPIGVNVATYVGFRTAGVPGAVTAVFGLALPSVIIIIIVARFLKKFRDNKYVEMTFYGIRPASAGLITMAVFTLMRLCLFDIDALMRGDLSGFISPQSLLLFAVLMFLMRFRKTKKLHPLAFIAISAAAGVIFF